MPTAATMPIHPHDAPDVIAAARVLAEARASLAEVEGRMRELEEASHSLDALCRVNADRERSTIYQRHLTAKADLIRAERGHEQARTVAMGPWRDYWHAQYRQAALVFLDWLEREALPANEAMLAAQDACETAGIHVTAIHVPQLLPDAVAHRINVSREGLRLPLKNGKA